MFFKIFSRWTKAERQRRKIGKIMKEVCKTLNPELILELEKNKSYHGEIYFAIKEVLESNILRKTPEFYNDASKLLASIGLVSTLKMLRDMNKDDPLSTFCILVEVYARIFTEEEFRRLFRDFFGFSPKLMDAFIFENPNLNLQFTRD